MRKLTIALTAAVGLAACGGQGNWQSVSLTGPARATGQAGTECVRNELRDLGYEVGSAQAAGSITGVRRNEVAWYLRPLGLRPTVDQITAQIEQGQLRVTAISTTDITTEGRVTGNQANTASEAARANAEQILQECGTRAA